MMPTIKESIAEKIKNIPKGESRPTIMTLPICDDNYIQFTKHEWMVILVINKESVEVLGTFKEWVMAEISERALAEALNVRRA